MEKEEMSAESSIEKGSEADERVEQLTEQVGRIESAIAEAQNVEDVLLALTQERQNAPMFNTGTTEQAMISLDKSNIAGGKMIPINKTLSALNDLRQLEATAVANESSYDYVEADLDLYSDELPGYILDRIANLPRFQKPQ